MAGSADFTDVNLLRAKVAISSSANGTADVWDLDAGRVLRSFGHDDQHVIEMTVARSGKRAISWSRLADDRGVLRARAFFDGTLKVWNLDTGSAHLASGGCTGSVLSVVVTPDGKLAVFAHADSTLRVWDVATGRVLRVLRGHSGPVSSVAMMPNGKRAVSGSEDGTLRVWDVATGRVLRVLRSHSEPVSSVAVTPNGKRAVSVSKDGTLRLWHLMTGWELRGPGTSSASVKGVAVTPDGKWALHGNGESLSLWNLKNPLWELGVFWAAPILCWLAGVSGSVNGTAISPDGKLVYCAFADKRVEVLDLVTGWALPSLKGHSDAVRGVAVRQDGKRVVSVPLQTGP